MVFEGLHYEVYSGVWVVDLPGLVMFLFCSSAMKLLNEKRVTNAELSHGRIVELVEYLFILLVLTERFNGIIDKLHLIRCCSLVFCEVQKRIYRWIESRQAAGIQSSWSGVMLIHIII